MTTKYLVILSFVKEWQKKSPRAVRLILESATQTQLPFLEEKAGRRAGEGRRHWPFESQQDTSQILTKYGHVCRTPAFI